MTLGELIDALQRISVDRGAAHLHVAIYSPLGGDGIYVEVQGAEIKTIRVDSITALPRATVCIYSGASRPHRGERNPP